MLGDKISESRGKITGQRILAGDDHRYVKIEISIQETGTVVDAEGSNVGTYTAFERVPGQIYGEGRAWS